MKNNYYRKYTLEKLSNILIGVIKNTITKEGK